MLGGRVARAAGCCRTDQHGRWIPRHAAATLRNGGALAPDSPIFGRKLSRVQGLSHPRLAEFWHVVDTVLEHDQLVRHHVYGVAPRRSRRRTARTRRGHLTSYQATAAHDGG